jgi:uncharacterized protein YegL
MLSFITANRLESLSLSRSRIIPRILLINVLFGLILILNPAIIASRNSPRWLTQTRETSICADKVKFDVAFLVDQSGSLAKRGQSYNIEIDGIIRAVRDQTIIPRDGSVSLTVLTFNGNATVSIPLTQINSDCDAEEFAADVENLKCGNIGIQQGIPQLAQCPFGDTNYTEAINKADRHLRQVAGPGTRRVLIMSTDGEPTDSDKGFSASTKISANAIRDGIVMELDVILIGLDPDSPEFITHKATVNEIVFPQPGGDLPGAVFVINGGDCNLPDANLTANDCTRQAVEFAADVRNILRGHVSHIDLVVTTNEDPLEDANIEGKLSLRQAIELANCHQGAATITFAENVQNKTIRLNAPLPALAAPDIKIDGCTSDICIPTITIDGSKFRDQSLGEDQSDGILIRSNHDEVRGLRIVNFRRAGIAIAPILQTDSLGHNLIESNTIERTGETGILIIDSPQAEPLSCPVNITAHNVGNTISKNTILQESPLPGEMSRNSALIDLGGDGPTPNDTGDPDEGPNTLLNFPELLTIDVETTPDANAPAATTAKITGQAAGLSNAKIEIFGITRLNTNDCNLAVEGVAFLAETTTGLNGAFSLEQVPISPTGAFIATITDADGNTSELTSGCLSRKRAAVIIEGNSSMIQFDAAGARIRKKAKELQARKFTIQNVGCSPLTLTLKVNRIDDRICQNKDEDCLNDTGFFSISRIINDTQEEPVFSKDGKSISITIQQGRCQDFLVRFNPVMPVVTKVIDRLSAKDILPDKIMSQIVIEPNDLGAAPITLVGQIKTAFQLISCEKEKRPALVTLERSGDDFIVVLFIYDSNRNVDTARFEFFDANKNRVGVDQNDVNLGDVIDKINPIPGQSFAVIQRFSNASKHPEVRSVNVTVFDTEKESASATSDPSVFPTCVGDFRNLQNSTIILLPETKLSSSHQKRKQRGVQRKRNNTLLYDRAARKESPR